MKKTSLIMLCLLIVTQFAVVSAAPVHTDAPIGLSDEAGFYKLELGPIQSAKNK